jgi:hypothetical protein
MDLHEKLKARMYAQRPFELAGEVWELWLRKIGIPEYMEIFGSCFADLAAAQPGYQPKTPQEMARHYRLLQGIVRAGVVAGPHAEEPSAPYFSEDELVAMEAGELADIANAILEFSGLTKGVAETATKFPEEPEALAEVGADSE